MNDRTLPFSLLFLFLFNSLAVGQNSVAPPAPATAAAPAPWAAADAFRKSGKLDEAAQLYKALLAADPKRVHARVGLMQVLLRQQRVEEAYGLGKAGLAMSSYTTELLAEMGDVEFRRGEMMEAEGYYLHALRVNEREMRAYLGLAQLYDAYSMHRMAYDRLKDAHALAPRDPDVQRAWFGMLPRRERLQSIEEYLSSPHPDDEDYTRNLRRYADFLRATVDKPVHACRLVSSVKVTQTPLIILRPDPRHVEGFGLPVKLNQHSVRLKLDTGANGILISRNAAESAGLERIINLGYSGVGSGGSQGGYTAVAKHVRIGELEFEDCVVYASDKPSIIDGVDGLIGADVVGSYLIDIDGPALKLKLSPLPKRPEEETAPTALDTGDEDAGEKDTAEKATKKAELRLPKDRYVAPEMKDWSTVFRFGAHLLIPTTVNDSQNMLFLIDTGASHNMISTVAASKVTKVSRDEAVKGGGLSGPVDFYSADKVKLHFSHFTQQYYNVLSFDLSNISRLTGTEVSGLLGLDMLGMMEVKIDYRDGLVDFSYDPKRVPGFAH
jgi:tetratricopeptide (TPR) repeat protein